MDTHTGIFLSLIAIVKLARCANWPGVLILMCNQELVLLACSNEYVMTLVSLGGGSHSTECFPLYRQGDHLSGKPGNTGEFDSCQGNVSDFTKNQGNVREKILSGKSCLNCLF